MINPTFRLSYLSCISQPIWRCLCRWSIVARYGTTALCPIGTGAEPRVVRPAQRYGAAGSVVMISNKLVGTRTFAMFCLACLSPIPNGLSVCNVSGQNRNSRSDQLVVAAGAGDLELAKRLIENGADPNGRDSLGRPLLWTAAMHDENNSMLRLLLEHGASIDARDVEKQRSPLAIAVHGGGPKKRRGTPATPCRR